MNTLSNLLRSTHQHRLSFASSARYFRSTVAPLQSPFGGGGDDDDEAEEFHSFILRQLEKHNEIERELEAMNPGSSKRCELSGPEMYAAEKRNILAAPPEAGAYLSEIFYWHPFQVEGAMRHFDVKTDHGGSWYGRIDLPGVCGGKVKVKVLDNTLYFSGEEGAAGFQGCARRYYGKFDIPAGGEYRFDKIDATLKNGVLEILIPKIKKKNCQEN
ncbi:hypothetical protein Tsubulata_036341 [Turnera subulata]|uniref:SHSP domain-containing protein n=1 Tax=Turnera subulata TaxID=218843 RepID=A0A9Q0JA54_9ROSI|nr:hypothetical protein Tsubulata_036341 [Turnera subulata]